ncbi:MAG TPA: DUF58 domain-containing protein [Planctomycetota bacterium]
MDPRRSVDLRSLPLVGRFVRAFQDRLTARGRFLFGTLVAFSFLGLDALTTRVYLLFAIAFGLFVGAFLFGFRARPRVRLSGGAPARATAGTPVTFHVVAEGDAVPDLHLAFPAPPGVKIEPAEAPGPKGVATLLALRRGRYEVRGARASRADPLGLFLTAAERLPDRALLVYPRFTPLDVFEIPVGRRHQPGGIPLSSNTGDSVEFVGTRDYREGDPIRAIHWRSWARRGAPVVKEYQEEYFCRIAIVLDTFARPGPGFERSISAVASIADFFSRSEYVVDILAAGPDVYEVSAGRSLAYLENILDVLACLEPCADPPFQTIGPAVFERLSSVTTVVAVLQDWDPTRLDFLRRVKAAGTSVRVILTREGLDTGAAAEEFDGIETWRADA